MIGFVGQKKIQSIRFAEVAFCLLYENGNCFFFDKSMFSSFLTGRFNCSLNDMFKTIAYDYVWQLNLGNLLLIEKKRMFSR